MSFHQAINSPRSGIHVTNDEQSENRTKYMQKVANAKFQNFQACSKCSTICHRIHIDI